MGIFLNLYVSRFVTKEEWNSVYEESLIFVDEFPLAEPLSKIIVTVKRIVASPQNVYIL